MNSNPQVRVGVGVMVFKKGKLLLGKRKNAHGDGEYAGLGGHLEFGESVEDCVKREAKEEAGIEVGNIKFLCLSSLKRYEGKHYIDIGMTAEIIRGEPKIMEPEKCESWGWYDLDNLPRPLFAAEENYLQALNSDKKFFDE